MSQQRVVPGTRCAQERRGKDLPKVQGRSLLSLPQARTGSSERSTAGDNPPCFLFSFLKEVVFSACCCNSELRRVLFSQLRRLDQQ